MINFFAFLGMLLIAVPITLLLSIVIIAWRSLWLFPAWAWFIVPLGLPQISFWHFAALLLIISILTWHVDEKKDERKTDWTKVVTSLLTPVAVWVMLWWMHGRLGL